jgi:hypothetical protein
MFRHRFLPLFLAWSLIIPLGLFTAGRVAASCNPGRSADGQYYWAASSEFPSSYVGGVSSYIYNYNPYVTGNGFSYAWVMLAGGPGANHAQIGNYKSANSRNVVIQFQISGQQPINVNFAAQPENRYTTYKITASSNNTYNYYVDNTMVYSQVMPWTPNNAEWAAETWQLSSQMMGGVSNQEYLSYNQDFHNASWFYATVNPWLSTTGSRNPSTYFGLGGTAYNFLTWDKTCAS